jgi:hypothetical protein
MTIKYNNDKGERMTWSELKQYIDSQDKSFLEQPVKLYDFSNGEEFFADVTELLNGNDGWTPYISINTEENNGETQETSID